MAWNTKHLNRPIRRGVWMAYGCVVNTSRFVVMSQPQSIVSPNLRRKNIAPVLIWCGFYVTVYSATNDLISSIVSKNGRKVCGGKINERRNENKTKNNPNNEFGNVIRHIDTHANNDGDSMQWMEETAINLFNNVEMWIRWCVWVVNADEWIAWKSIVWCYYVWGVWNLFPM